MKLAKHPMVWAVVLLIVSLSASVERAVAQDSDGAKSTARPRSYVNVREAHRALESRATTGKVLLVI